MEYQVLRGEFSRFVRTAPHWQLKELSKELRAVQKERFISGRGRQCELVELAFTDEELERFMEAVDNPMDKICYTLMSVLGLRVGELCALRGEALEGDQLRIPTLKGGHGAVIRLPSSLLSLIPCVGPKERIFPITTKTLRERFRKYRAKAGLNEVYMTTEPCGKARIRNRRFRLSLHSLRRYAIWNIYKLKKDPDLARRFARHKHLQTTLEYFKSSRKDEIDALLGEICEPQTLRTLNRFEKQTKSS